MRAIFISIFLVAIFSPVEALASAAAAAALLKDHSGAAIGLFNNMRTPAALIGGSLVPLGILNAPRVEENDSKVVAFMKKANVILGVTSLLSEVLAVTYSSIAINKLAEVESPLTRGCAQLIAQNYELAWIGTNVHFLLGLMGFGLIVGSKAYISNGPAIGKVTIGWAVAAFLQSAAIVNKGIAMGHGSSAEVSAKFASNFGSLIWRYLALVVKSSTQGVLSVAAILVTAYALFETARVLLPAYSKDRSKNH